MRPFVGGPDRRRVRHGCELDVAADERDDGVRDAAELAHVDGDPLPPQPGERDPVGDVGRVVGERVADLDRRLRRGGARPRPVPAARQDGRSGEREDGQASSGHRRR